jgi:hypothetical protein
MCGTVKRRRHQRRKTFQCKPNQVRIAMYRKAMEVRQLHYANDDIELRITHELNVALDIYLPVRTLLLQCWARFFFVSYN